MPTTKADNQTRLHQAVFDTRINPGAHWRIHRGEVTYTGKYRVSTLRAADNGQTFCLTVHPSFGLDGSPDHYTDLKAAFRDGKARADARRS